MRNSPSLKENKHTLQLNATCDSELNSFAIMISESLLKTEGVWRLDEKIHQCHFSDFDGCTELHRSMYFLEEVLEHQVSNSEMVLKQICTVNELFFEVSFKIKRKKKSIYNSGHLQSGTSTQWPVYPRGPWRVPSGIFYQHPRQPLPPPHWSCGAGRHGHLRTTSLPILPLAHRGASSSYTGPGIFLWVQTGNSGLFCSVCPCLQLLLFFYIFSFD